MEMRITSSLSVQFSFRAAVRLPFAKGKEDQGAARRRQGQRPSGVRQRIAGRRSQLQHPPRERAKALSYRQPGNGRRCESAFALLSHKKVTKRLPER